MAQHICLITSGHLYGNPRLRKELLALNKKGFEISVVFVQTIAALQTMDDSIMRDYPSVSFRYVAATPQKKSGKWLRIKSGIRQRIFQKLVTISRYFTSKAFSRFLPEQARLCRTINADLYIAHNLAALPVAAQVAAQKNKPYAFDAEDFHRGEYPVGSLECQIVKKIEDKYFPSAFYITAASPLIADAYQQIYVDKQFIVINNVFPLHQQPLFRPGNLNTQRTLRLFWFSQNLGRNRGIQDVLNALKLVEDIPLEIDLLGQCSPEDFTFFEAFINTFLHRLNILGSVSENELIMRSATYDIGLALEPGFSQNNDLALSNKIFTYLLAGNAILASETQAQKLFLHQYPQVGASYPIGDAAALAKIIRFWWENPDVLEDKRKAAWQLANEDLNWDKELQKWISLINFKLKL